MRETGIAIRWLALLFQGYADLYLLGCRGAVFGLVALVAWFGTCMVISNRLA